MIDVFNVNVNEKLLIKIPILIHNIYLSLLYEKNIVT